MSEPSIGAPAIAREVVTEQDYDAIAARCDLLLRAPGTSLERVAIPMLHVVSEHPAWMSHYAPVLEAQRIGKPLPPRNLSAEARMVARIGRDLGRSLRHAAQAHGAGATLTGVDVLIVSHLTDPAQIGDAEDFYFGNLQGLLDERGVTSALVWVDYLRTPDARLACIARLGNSRRWLLPRAVAPMTEARIWLRCLAAARRLRLQATGLATTVSGPGWERTSTPSDRLHSSLAALSSRHALYEATVANLRLHESVASLCRQLRPRIVVTTHEGDSCDRMIWHAARSANPWTLCVGYQHTRMLARAHAIRRSVRVEHICCDPDVILTVGEFARSELSQCAELSAVRLITYGSHRRAGVTTPSTAFGQRPRACLVLPDAYEIESVLLFAFALDCARARPDITFILRPHPVVDLLALRSRHASLHELPTNVRVSRGTLEQECLAAKYCLYRGSSAVVHAVLHGLKPFYLARAGELPLDPLYPLDEWREVVSSADEFVRQVAHAELADASYEADAAARARQLCERLISPLRPEALGELLEWASQRAGLKPAKRAMHPGDPV